MSKTKAQEIKARAQHALQLLPELACVQGLYTLLVMVKQRSPLLVLLVLLAGLVDAVILMLVLLVPRADLVDASLLALVLLAPLADDV